MATTKKLGFENLLPYASMGKDSNGDGVVDGWSRTTDPNATTSWLFDSTEQAQVINVTAATGFAAPGVRIIDFVPVTANTQYTFSVYIKAEGNLVAGSTGPRFQIDWHDASQAYISTSTSSVFTDTVLTRRSFSAIAPSNAAYARVSVNFRCNDSSSYGTVWAKWAQFERGQNLLVNPAMNVDTNADNVADGYSANTSGTITATRVIDTTENAQKIEVTSSGSAGSWASVYQEIPVVAGKAYSFSVDVKTGAGIEGRFYISWYSDSGSLNLFSTFTYIPANTDWQRYAVSNQVAPSGAKKARFYFQAYCRNGGETGPVWFKNAKFEEGPTATDFGVSNPRDYEETDFFTRVDLAPTYTKGWVKDSTYKQMGGYGYTSETVAAGDATYSGAQIKYTVPVNAKNISISIWADTSRVTTADNLNIFVNGNLVLTIPGGRTGTIYTVSDANWSAIRRGYQVITLQHVRTSSSNGGSITIDDFSVTWDEETNPTVISLPAKDVVKYLDFEQGSEGLDPFFAVQNKAAGYNYGWAITERRSYSGFYSYGVEDIDVDGSGIDEAGRAPTIPDGAKAGASIKFKIPITAIDPILSFKALHHAETSPGIDKGTYTLNGQVVWESSQYNVWESVDVPLNPGQEYELLLDFTKNPAGFAGTDSVYIDDIIVAYDIPDKPLMYVATAPTTEIKTTSTSFSVTEGFEDPFIDKFFTVQNPSKLKSGGLFDYPEAGWGFTKQIAYQGTYSFKALREKLPPGGDAAVDFTFRVPHGVKDAKLEWWNFVELERSKYIPSGAQYNRLYDEYRIWVNYSLWKDFHYCSPSLTQSVHYTGPESLGDPANDYACPWGRWWKETLPLTPGRTYTITFELQLNTTDSSSNISGRKLCAIDNLTVSWTETPGDVVVTPPQPLIFFDGRDGYTHLYDRSGAEMAPLSFAEYKVYGSPGSVHQFTQIEPRDVEFPVMIEGVDQTDVRQKVRNLTTQLANKPLVLAVVQPDGDVRQLNCRFAELTGRETPDEHFITWKKAILSFRAFDPFWYGERVVVDGADATKQISNDPKWVLVNNQGDAEAWPIIKIYGPVTSPLVKLTTPDNTNALKQFKLTGFTVSAGRYVVVDTRPGRKTIILDDGQSLYQYLDASINELFSIPQGEYGVNLSGSSTDANTKIAVEFQPPYWGV